jgi:hypothetical protein
MSARVFWEGQAVDKVILGDELLNQLAGEGGSVELYDKAGRAVGYFLSPDEYKKLVYAWAIAEFARDDLEDPIDDNDETGSMTTAELLAHLESLGSAGGNAA